MKSIDSVLLKDSLSSSHSNRSNDEHSDVEDILAHLGESNGTNSDAVVIAASFGSGKADSANPDFQELYKSLNITAKEIIDKLNERLKISLPDGIQSLKPEDVTPEATADRIVKGATAFFDIFAKQNKNLEGEELLNSFLGEIKKGIDEGYDDAFGILKGLGAFEYDGVQEGVEKTRSLIDEKLAAYETAKRKELGLDSEVEDAASASTKDEILSQAGSTLNTVA